MSQHVVLAVAVPILFDPKLGMRQTDTPFYAAVFLRFLGSCCWMHPIIYLFGDREQQLDHDLIFMREFTMPTFLLLILRDDCRDLALFSISFISSILVSLLPPLPAPPVLAFSSHLNTAIGSFKTIRSGQLERFVWTVKSAAHQLSTPSPSSLYLGANQKKCTNYTFKYNPCRCPVSPIKWSQFIMVTPRIDR